MSARIRSPENSCADAPTETKARLAAPTVVMMNFFTFSPLLLRALQADRRFRPPKFDQRRASATKPSFDRRYRRDRRRLRKRSAIHLHRWIDAPTPEPPRIDMEAQADVKAEPCRVWFAALPMDDAHPSHQL